jgi:hypothetical protein
MALKRVREADARACEERGVMRKAFQAQHDRYVNHAKNLFFHSIRAQGYDPVTMEPTVES